MIQILQGDITKATVDAIVNAANPVMLGGGGVDGAIHRAAGPRLLEACRKVPSVKGVRCPTGEARITEAGNLASKYVIHTVGPIYRKVSDPALLLKRAYDNSLRLAMDYGCKSIAFPAISCGVYGYPHDEAARIALGVCGPFSLQGLKIDFYLFGRGIFDVWSQISKEILKED